MSSAADQRALSLFIITTLCQGIPDSFIVPHNRTPYTTPSVPGILHTNQLILLIYLSNYSRFAHFYCGFENSQCVVFWSIREFFYLFIVQKVLNITIRSSVRTERGTAWAVLCFSQN